MIKNLTAGRRCAKGPCDFSVYIITDNCRKKAQRECPGWQEFTVGQRPGYWQRQQQAGEGEQIGHVVSGKQIALCPAPENQANDCVEQDKKVVLDKSKGCHLPLIFGK